MKLAIITARGGSKRIPRKNIRNFCGKPIIAYSILAAKESGCFDEVMVSTDDLEIAEVAKKWGAIVPFMRSEQTSTDYATTAEVLVEVLENYKKLGKEISRACCIYPTAPFVTPKTLSSAYNVFVKNPDAEIVIPVVRFSYPIQRALKMREDMITLFSPEHLLSRSQDLEPAYHDAGQFYWFQVNAFLKEQKLMTAKTVGFELPPWLVQDIDNEDDWILAEMKYRLIQENQTMSELV